MLTGPLVPPPPLISLSLCQGQRKKKKGLGAGFYCGPHVQSQVPHSLFPHPPQPPSLLLHLLLCSPAHPNAPPRSMPCTRAAAARAISTAPAKARPATAGVSAANHSCCCQRSWSQSPSRQRGETGGPPTKMEALPLPVPFIRLHGRATLLESIPPKFKCGPWGSGHGSSSGFQQAPNNSSSLRWADVVQPRSPEPAPAIHLPLSSTFSRSILDPTFTSTRRSHHGRGPLGCLRAPAIARVARV